MLGTSPLLLLARRRLASQPARVALTAGGVAAGVALVIAIAAINESTLRSFRTAIEDMAGSAALQVRGPGRFPRKVADRVRTVAGVDHAVPILQTTFYLNGPPQTGEAVSVFATDVTDAHTIKTFGLLGDRTPVVADGLGFLVDPYSVIITEELATRLRTSEGRKIALRTPRGVRRFTVRGILPAGGVGRAYGGNLALLDLYAAQYILGIGDKIDQIDITLVPGARTDEVRQRIAAVLPGGFEVQRPARRGEQIEDYLSSFQSFLSGTSSLALVAALFMIYNAVATSVAARHEETAILRCLGALRRDVVRAFLAEAMLVGAAGAGLGLALGVCLAQLLVGTLTESTELVYSIDIFSDSRVVLSSTTVSTGVVAAIAGSAAAGWHPAWAAAAMSPAAALRAARGGPSAGKKTPALILAGAGALLTAAALLVEVNLDSPAWGTVAAVLADLTLVGLVVPYVRPAGNVLAAALCRLGAVGRLAGTNLARAPAPAALAVGVLALALGFMIMAASLTQSFERSVLGFIRRQVRADLIVASASSTGWIEAPIEEQLGEEILRTPGVARIEGLRLAEFTFRGRRVSLDSLDPTAFAPERRRDFTFSAGDPETALAAVRTGAGVLVSQNFALHFDVGTGSTLALPSPSGPQHFRVVGIVVDYVSPLGSIVLSRAVYRRLWHDTRVNRFHVTLTPAADPEAVRSALASALGVRHGLKVLTLGALYRYHLDAVRRAFRPARALEFLPLVVATLALADALLVITLERRRELAIVRAVGGRRMQVAADLILEGAGLGGIGLIAGALVGFLLALLWVRVNFTHQIGWIIDLHFAWGALGHSALATAAVVPAASLLPALRAARLPLLVALRRE